jgi:hypothetical protein
MSDFEDDPIEVEMLRGDLESVNEQLADLKESK